MQVFAIPLTGAKQNPTEIPLHTKLSISHSVVSDFLQPHGLKPTRLLYPWNSPGKNTGMGCHSLLQEIFPTQASNSGLPHCRQIVYSLSHQKTSVITCKLYFLQEIHLFFSFKCSLILAISNHSNTWHHSPNSWKLAFITCQPVCWRLGKKWLTKQIWFLPSWSFWYVDSRHIIKWYTGIWLLIAEWYIKEKGILWTTNTWKVKRKVAH